MAESIRFDLRGRPLEPLEPDKLRKLLALAYEVGATPVFAHDELTVEVTGPGFVVVAAGKVQGGQALESIPAEPCRTLEVVVKATCVCSDWDVGMRQITVQQVFSSLRSVGPGYDAPMFRYCPWCGVRLLECEKSEEVVVG